MDKYNHWLPKLIAPKTSKTWAITLGQTTYYSVEQSLVTPAWRKHEEVHKDQWVREGFLKFAVKYLWYNFKLGYDKNPYEVEARFIAGI